MSLAFRCFSVLATAGALFAASAPTPTYNKDIAPILYAKCAMCHRPGEVAPFSLLTYQDTAKRAALISTMTKSRLMPPWKPEPGFGEFKDSRRLTDEQLALIQQWASHGAPEGDPALKPKPPVFADGWLLGQPDKVVTLPGKFSVSPDGPDQFRCFVIPTNSDQDLYLGAMEFRPDDRRTVHHALVFLDPRHQGRKLADGSADGGYTCFGGPGFLGALIGGWAPGFVPSKPVEGYATPLPKGTDLVIQIHYHPSGKPAADQSSLGLFYSPPPTHGRTSLIVASENIDIPPGDADYKVKAQITVPADAELVRVTPHAHYLCKEMKLTAHLPDGTVTPLIWIKDWDFNWQSGYAYVTPIRLPKGTLIDMEYTYDNSASNPRNPARPPVRVTYGEQTANEMGLAFLTFSLPTPADAVAFRRAAYGMR
jgi:mono/diheme cytochrome c family protein